MLKSSGFESPALAGVRCRLEPSLKIGNTASSKAYFLGKAYSQSVALWRSAGLRLWAPVEHCVLMGPRQHHLIHFYLLAWWCVTHTEKSAAEAYKTAEKVWAPLLQPRIVHRFIQLQSMRTRAQS